MRKIDIPDIEDIAHGAALLGAGGGGYLACVVEDAERFCKEDQNAISLTIRRPGM